VVRRKKASKDPLLRTAKTQENRSWISRLEGSRAHPRIVVNAGVKKHPKSCRSGKTGRTVASFIKQGNGQAHLGIFCLPVSLDHLGAHRKRTRGENVSQSITEQTPWITRERTSRPREEGQEKKQLKKQPSRGENTRRIGLESGVLCGGGGGVGGFQKTVSRPTGEHTEQNRVMRRGGWVVEAERCKGFGGNRTGQRRQSER